MALQQIVSRRLPPQQATVVSVTSIDAPSFEPRSFPTKQSSAAASAFPIRRGATRSGS
jgi:hypothetical protein